jgi:CBS-domain-containing membrane protein
MRTDVNYVTAQIIPAEIKNVLKNSSHTFYPVVDSHETMILVGSVSRVNLEELCMAVETYEKLAKTKAEKQLQLKKKINRRSRPKRKFSFSINALRKELQELGDATGMRTARRMYKEQQEATDTTNNDQDEESRLGTLEQENNPPIVQIGSYSMPLNSEPQLTYKLVQNETVREFTIGFDPSPLSVSIFSPLTKLHFLFSTLRLSHVWVTAGGKLVGVVAKKDMIDAKL